MNSFMIIIGSIIATFTALTNLLMKVLGLRRTSYVEHIILKETYDYVFISNYLFITIVSSYFLCTIILRKAIFEFGIIAIIIMLLLMLIFGVKKKYKLVKFMLLLISTAISMFSIISIIIIFDAGYHRNDLKIKYDYIALKNTKHNLVELYDLESSKMTIIEQSNAIQIDEFTEKYNDRVYLDNDFYSDFSNSRALIDYNLLLEREMAYQVVYSINKLSKKNMMMNYSLMLLILLLYGQIISKPYNELRKILYGVKSKVEFKVIFRDNDIISDGDMSKIYDVLYYKDKYIFLMKYDEKKEVVRCTKDSVISVRYSVSVVELDSIGWVKSLSE